MYLISEICWITMIIIIKSKQINSNQENVIKSDADHIINMWEINSSDESESSIPFSTVLLSGQFFWFHEASLIYSVQDLYE